MKGYPRRFLPGLVSVLVLLAVSGFLLVPTALDLRFGWGVPWRLPGSQRVWMAALHSGTAFLMCGFAGALWSVHMRVGWRSRRHLLSGLSTTAMLAGAALTALGVFYFGDETWLLTSSAGHILLGASGTLCGGVHWLVAVMERARRRAPVRRTSREATGPTLATRRPSGRMPGRVGS